MADGRRPSRQVRRAQARRKQPIRKTLQVAHFVFPLLVAAGLIAYHNAFRGPFVLDDIPAITWNTTIRTLWPPSTVLSPPPRTAATGRPIVNLSLALNYASGGLNVTSYHLFNLAFHVLAAVVLFGIVRRALVAPALGERFRERATGIAASVSLLWVVHPLTSECIDYTIPNSASAHHNLARALVRQGLTIEAIEHFETALRLQPDFPSARRALEDLRRSLNQ